MPRPCPITFGTSGWRGIIADDFTFANVRIAALAIACFLKEKGMQGQGVVVGYDTRFLSEKFAKEVVGVLTHEGVACFVCQRPTPTPVIAHEILRRSAAGGVNITASHNPPIYNGLKFSPEWGGPALPETTQRLEVLAQEIYARDPSISTLDLEEAATKSLFVPIDPSEAYFATLDTFLDVGVIQRAKPKVLVDVLHGTGAGHLDHYLTTRGVKVQVRRANPDPTFDGMAPEPAPEELAETVRIVQEQGFDIALATDGDADRYGVVDKGGTFVLPNVFLGLLYHELIAQKGMKGDAARSVATSHFLDAVAMLHGQRAIETKVGFKYLGQALWEGRALLAGEESAGLSLKGHVPEKDGILACLLALEAVCRNAVPLKSLQESLWLQTGPFYTSRVNLPFESAKADALQNILEEEPKELAGVRMASVSRLDGTKWVLEDGSWILLRPSGTEPVVRMYIEARSEQHLRALEAHARELMGALWTSRP